MNFQKLWDSCAQNNTSEISKTALSEFMGLLSAEQHAGNLKECTFIISGSPVRRTTLRKSQKLHFHISWDSCAQNKTSDISETALPEILGLQCAEQKVGHSTECTFINSGTLARRTTRRKSRNMYFQNFWESGSQNKTSKISKQ